MQNAISPGIYVSVTPLESYVQSVPSTIAFICVFSDKGPDNQLINLAAQSQSYLQMYGQPNLQKYTSAYGQGAYVAYSFNTVASSLYVLRLLPPDATYSAMGFYFVIDTTLNEFKTIVQPVLNYTNLSDIDTLFYNNTNPNNFGLPSTSNVFPLFVVQSKNRGEFYNNFQFGSFSLANSINSFNFQDYELLSDNQYHAKGNWNVSFNPNVVNSSGMNIFAPTVINQNDNNIMLTYDSDTFSSTLNIINETLYSIRNSTNSSIFQIQEIITDISQIDSSLYNETLNYYVGPNASNALFGLDGQIVTIQNGQIVSSTLTSSTSGNNNTIEPPIGSLLLDVNQNFYIVLGFGEYINFDPFTYAMLIPADSNDNVSARQLSGASDGSLINSNGTINSTVANELLIQGYTGLIDNSVINTDTVYFSIVLDGGYPQPAKQAMVQLTSEQLLNSVAILDLGYNLNAEQELNARTETYNFDTPYTALYSQYRQITDPFSGQNIWVTPVYSVCRLIALNDQINAVWYAVAGYENGIDPNIISLVYSPTPAEQVLFNENQINPTVQFSDGTVLWGQQTSQRMSGPLQSLNVTRTYLYINRALQQYCKYYLFNLDDPMVLTSIEDQIKIFLSNVQAQNGLYSYSASVTATESQEIQKTAVANVTLFPVRDLEILYLNFFIQ